MRPERYDPEALTALLRQQKIATMEDLKQALGTSADATVFRKLAGLDYRTSYSHRGRYYTLDEMARFDELGLWSFRQVWFSRFGTLVSTVEALVAASESGYDAAELENLLHVGVTCTFPPKPPPGVPSWPPGRSMTARPASFRLARVAGTARGAQGGHRVVLQPAR
jgi:hypothetical protein